MGYFCRGGILACGSVPKQVGSGGMFPPEKFLTSETVSETIYTSKNLLYTNFITLYNMY